MTTPEEETQQRRSVFGLIGDLPRLVSQQVRGEVDLVKAQLKEKVGLFAVALIFMVVAVALLIMAIGVALIAAVWALAQALPLWASALIVAGGLIVIAAILALIGRLLIAKAGNTKLGSRSAEKADAAADEEAK